jgi:hypothetical protein
VKITGGKVFLNGKEIGSVDAKIELSQEPESGEPHAAGGISGTFKISKAKLDEIMHTPLQPYQQRVIDEFRNGSERVFIRPQVRLTPSPWWFDLEAEPLASLAQERTRRWFPMVMKGSTPSHPFDRPLIDAFYNRQLGQAFDEANTPKLTAEELLASLRKAIGVSDEMIQEPVYFGPNRAAQSLSLAAYNMRRHQRELEVGRQAMRSLTASMFHEWFRGLFGPTLAHHIAKIYNKGNDYANPRTAFAASVVSAVWNPRQGLDVPALARRIVVPSIGSVPRRPPRGGDRGPHDRRSTRKPFNQ